MKSNSNYLFILLILISNIAMSQITLVKDIRVGSAGSLINNPEFVVFNNALYFFADDGVHGKELWKSDGTTAGTVMVKDIVAGSGSSFPASLTVSGDLFYFTANDVYLEKNSGNQTVHLKVPKWLKILIRELIQQLIQIRCLIIMVHFFLVLQMEIKV